MAGGVHIVKEHATGWTVKREGAHRASSSHKTQADAVAAARRLALKSGGAEVVIHRSDGRIRDVDTVGAAKLDALRAEGFEGATSPRRTRATARNRSGTRAPRGDGPRTTLRLPTALARVADQLAKDLGVSRNDAVLRLATRGARLFEQEQRIGERREERWAAVVPGIVDIDHADFPAQREAQEAILAEPEEPIGPAS